MPFDGVDFERDRKKPEREAAGEKVFRILFLVVAITMLVMPVSAAGLIDIVQYVRGK
ncbi:hypothetical protein [Lichenicoccus sp.]|uniref:hypothetical protein n=1 Tax=Lichenicoccus sp. TaxID=2781899 RepID=UPI003D10FEAB